MASETVKIGTPQWYQLVVCGLRQLKTHLASDRVPEWRGKTDAVRWIDAILKGKADVLDDRRNQDRRKTDRRDERMTVGEAREVALEMLEEAEVGRDQVAEKEAAEQAALEEDEDDEDGPPSPDMPLSSTLLPLSRPARHVRVFTDDDLMGEC